MRKMKKQNSGRDTNPRPVSAQLVKKRFPNNFFPFLFLEVTVIIFVQWIVGITGFRMTYKVSVFFHMKMFVQSSKIWMLYQKRPLTLRASLRDIRWYE